MSADADSLIVWKNDDSVLSPDVLRLRMRKSQNSDHCCETAVHCSDIDVRCFVEAVVQIVILPKYSPVMLLLLCLEDVDLDDRSIFF